MSNKIFAIVAIFLSCLCLGAAKAAEKSASAPVEQVRYTPEVVVQKRAGLQRAQELVRGHQKEWCGQEDRECLKKYDELLALGDSLIARLPIITTAKFGEELKKVMQLAEEVETQFDPARKQAAK